MNVFRRRLTGPGVFQQDASLQEQDDVLQVQDTRAQPTPDYGTLGPSPDFASSEVKSRSTGPVSDGSNPSRRPTGRSLLLPLIVMMGGIVAALVAHNAGQPPARKRTTTVSARQESSMVASTEFSERELDRQEPQRQAEMLLTRAVSPTGRHGEANQNEGQSTGQIDAKNQAEIEAQIQARIESWRGKLQWNSQLSQLTTAALNSDDEKLRNSAIEVQLAAYGLKKNDSTVDALVRQADSSNHQERIWAMWTLGLLGNRGVESERVVQVLSRHLQVSSKTSPRDREPDDDDVRHWAAEGLALVGTSSTITPLLEAMHNDPSPLVRESAACGLAQSGMLTQQQRLTAVPQLIAYSDDPALDAETHAWAFQALADITKQRLPNQSEAWREWYRETVVSGQ